MDDSCDKTEEEKIQNAKRAPCENIPTVWWSVRPVRLTSGGRLGGCRTGLGFRGEEGEPGKRFFTSWNIAGFIFEFCIAEKQCPHLCGCQRVCLRQDTSILTQLGQLSPQTVAVPGDLIRRTNKNVRLESLSKVHWWDKRGSFPLIVCPCFKPPPL